MAAAAMRLDLPVARSPTTTTRTLLRSPDVEALGIESQKLRSEGNGMAIFRISLLSHFLSLGNNSNFQICAFEFDKLFAEF